MKSVYEINDADHLAASVRRTLSFLENVSTFLSRVGLTLRSSARQAWIVNDSQNPPEFPLPH